MIGILDIAGKCEKENVSNRFPNQSVELNRMFLHWMSNMNYICMYVVMIIKSTDFLP